MVEGHMAGYRGKKAGKGRAIYVFLAAAVILAAVLAVMNAVKYSQIKRLEAEKTELVLENTQKGAAENSREAEIRTLSETLEILNDRISELEAELSQTEFEAEYKTSFYDELMAECKKDKSYGYGAESFCVSRGVVLLEKGGDSCGVALTADPDMVVTIIHHGDSARLEWDGGSELNVVSALGSRGVTTFKFMNSKDDSSFEMLVIVA